MSNDNPYSESLFRTLKYRPDYPDQPFLDPQAARLWVQEFVDWQNLEHRHSGVKFVTPVQRRKPSHGNMRRAGNFQCDVCSIGASENENQTG